MISEGRIRRPMRENGIYSITRYKYRPYPKEKVETRYTDNAINREFQVGKPDKSGVEIFNGEKEMRNPTLRQDLTGPFRHQFCPLHPR